MKNTSKTVISTEQTQEKLVQEGIKLFALHGISGLRTRQLAQDAGVNQSAIPYHFGGKLGVYTAVIQYIATELASEIHFDQFDNKLQSLLKENKLDRGSLASLISLLVSRLTQALLAPERHYYSQLILREQLEPTENYELIYRNFIEPFHLRLSHLIKLIDKNSKALTTTIRAHAIIGQILGFVIAKKAFLFRIDKQEITPQLLENITHEISQLSVSALFAIDE
ncbi:MULTISPECIES: CerR family C-terminal domain-containing protein [Enterobacterales]|uniref:CerR family C-terminal domain-containing protein n=1 Tax=Enterobacterales TaxID=91347 RepID=UPI000847FB41|nr:MULTISPECIES: CerR family C-terminal domain-containing protein [Enterobacterales]WOO48724.1 CerR family C-terminal domain-containing protein [Hafnia alvei]ODQ07107.1 TetR family transcriptional regulator [Shigella sp. FC130]OEI94502.1 TetR family transcriptional regulator [Shigella sp. FC1655]OEJ07906.1 TetR family transcriptional regulator [Shigella sp. FC1967]WPF03188.1 CerR family C-terminal domain-containing protein [Proteus vulgaris]